MKRHNDALTPLLVSVSEARRLTGLGRAAIVARADGAGVR